MRSLDLLLYSVTGGMGLVAAGLICSLFPQRHLFRTTARPLIP